MVSSFPIFRSPFVRYPSITHCLCPSPWQLCTDELSPNISLIRSTKPLLRLFSDVVAGFNGDIHFFSKGEVNGHRRLGVLLARDISVEKALEKVERAYAKLDVKL